MRKLFGLLTATLMLGLATVSSVYADTEIGVTVSVTGGIGFTLDKIAWGIGSMSVGATKTMGTGDVIAVTSTGTQPQTYNLIVYGSSWSTGPAPAANTYVMSARIQDATPVEADFIAGDIIPGSPSSLACDGTNFGGGGLNVAPAAVNKLWLQFKSPTTTTYTNEQTVIVKLGVQQ